MGFNSAFKGLMTTASVISTWISRLNLCPSVYVNSPRMTFQCRNMLQFKLNYILWFALYCILPSTFVVWGHAVAQLVEAPCYKPEGCGFDSVVSLDFFHWHNPSGRTMALGSTQPLTEMSTRNASWGWRQPLRRAENLTTLCADCLEIWEPQPPGTLRACPGL